MAHTLGPVSKAIAKVVNVLAGGHRRRTHSLVFCAGTGMLTAGLTYLPTQVGGVSLPQNWAVWVLVAFLLYTLMLALGWTISNNTRIGDGVYALQAIAATAALVMAVPGHWWWLPWAVGFGCLLHCLQDILTTGGLSWFLWPVSRARVRFACCGDTGDTREMIVAAAGFGALLWVGLALLAGERWWSISWLGT